MDNKELQNNAKFDLVFDIIDNPDKYGSERIGEIMSDPEAREIYNLICFSESALQRDKDIDVDSEWERFAEERMTRRRVFFPRFGSKAATIAAIVCTSIMAVAAGIAVTMKTSEHKSERKEMAQVSVVSDKTIQPDSLVRKDVTINSDPTPVMFENESLENIMNHVAAIFDVEVRFKNPATAELHLYYRLDPSLTVEEIVSQLNSFEQININQEGRTLIVD